MDNFTLISIGVGIFLVLLIFIARVKGSTKLMGFEDVLSGHSDQNVEYQWISEPRIAVRLVFLLLLAVSMVYLYFTVDIVREIFSSLFQVGMILLGFLGTFLSGLWKKRLYQLTDRGLFKLEKKSGKKEIKPEKVFLWSELTWFKPNNRGFRYYLKTPTPIPGTQDIASLIRTTGLVEAGDKAMVVNSIIMARGVRTSPGPRARKSTDPHAGK